MKAPDFNNLSSYYSNENILRKTIIQLRKDLALSEEEFELTNTNQSLFEQLVNQVQRVIDDLLDSSFERFSQCMYRIDISEMQLEQCKTNNNYDSALISEMVIKRCLQKVVIKEWYKKNTN